MTLGILFLLGLLVLAVVLLWHGVRGRWVGDEPRCKGCAYNLTGLESNRCPECGATLRDDLDRPLKIVYGRRQRSPVLVTFAVVTLLAFGTIFVSSVAQIKINWFRFAPTGWVTSSAESGARNAMDELVRRHKAQTLSAGQINDAIETGLSIQSAPTAHTLLAEWMDFLGDMLAGGDMTIEQETSFMKNSAIFTLTPRPEIRTGEQLVLRLGHEDRFASTPYLSMVLLEEDIRINNIVVDSGRGSSVGFGFAGTGGGGTSTYQVTKPVTLPPGDYEVALAIHRKIFIDSPQTAEDGPPDFEFDDVFLAPVTILPSDADSPIKTTSDPDLKSQIRDSMTIEELKIDMSHDTYCHFGCTIGFGKIGTEPPIDLAFRIIVKAGRFEQALGSLSCAKGHKTSSTNSIGTSLDDDAEFVDDLINAKTGTVIFRTDMEAARRTVDLMNVWDGEIQFDDVPLTVVKPTP